MNVDQQMDKREMSEKYQSALMAAIADDRRDWPIVETMPLKAVGEVNNE